MLTFDFWNWTDQEMDAAIVEQGLDLAKFNRDDLLRYIQEAYDEKRADGDPWRRGKMFFLRRAVEIMRAKGIAEIGE